MDDALKQRIDDLVKNNKVFLFMKGNPSFPQCGFSGHAVSLLSSYGVTFETFNVLEDESIRQGIKEYSDWPTIPQLYVNGEFVGGCDIMNELHQDGELEAILKG